MTTAGLYLWRKDTHYVSFFPIESEKHVMFVLWIGSQNDRDILFGSGCRSAGGDTS